MSEELTPEERAVASEGLELERRLREFKGEKPKSLILGSDGRPVETEPAPIESVEGAQTGKAADKAALEYVKKQIEDRANKLTAIMNENEAVLLASEVVLSAWQLLFYALNDLGTHKGMTNAMIEQLSNSMRAAAVQGGVNVVDLRANILGGKRKRRGESIAKTFGVIPYLNDRIQYYADASRLRKSKLKEIQRRMGDAGIALPCHTLKQLYPKEPFFNAGRVIILRGELRAVRAALRLCAFEHQTKNRGEPYYLSSGEKVQEWDSAFKVLPLVWWKDAAQNDHKLMEVLEPVVTSKSLLLLVENLSQLGSPASSNERPGWERRAVTIGMLYQWAVENMVALIIGDVVDDEEFDERTYGGLPHVIVTVAKDASGNEVLVIGNDTLPFIMEA